MCTRELFVNNLLKMPCHIFHTFCIGIDLFQRVFLIPGVDS